MEKTAKLFLKFVNNIKSMNKYRLTSFIFIILYACLLMVMARNQPIQAQLGESWLYVMSTAALQYEQSIYITQTTLDNVYYYFYDYHGVAYFYYGIERFVVTNGQFLSYYFPAYSLICIPASVVLGLFGFNQSWAFAITNIGLIIMALFCMLLFLKECDKLKFFLLLVLAINPIVLYVFWASSEIFIWAFLVMSLVFYFNKAYKRSAFFLTVAGSMNMTLMILGFFMIASYFIDLQKEKGVDRNFIKTVFKNFFDVLKYAASFSFIFLALLYNYIASGGESSVATMVGSGGIPWEDFGATIPQRFFAYLFDLNFGLLPWFLILFLLYPACLIYSFIRNKYEYYLLIIGHLAVMFLFSGMAHINSGMTGISRYNAWAAPIILFTCILWFFKLRQNTDRENITLKRMKIINSVKISIVSLSVVLTGLLVYDNSYDIALGYRTMLAPARVVLNNAPSLYNPLWTTFVSRIENVDGGYAFNRPTIYDDSKGNVRKILMNPGYAYNLTDMLTGNEESFEWLNKKITNVELKQGFQYIDICPMSGIVLHKLKPAKFMPPNATAIVGGIHWPEHSPSVGNYVWTTQTATLRLQAVNQSQVGLRVDYYVSEHLFIANPDTDLEMKVFIDNNHIETISLHDIGVFSRFIAADKIPYKENWEQYDIRIEINGSFMPSLLPAPHYGNDSRSLSIMLLYVG
ncbi:MAG: hypothetical protein FWD38_00885 [Oscillospiraceae bacterium]|nr:hypothetical protein [Oscillospiraceae bacterium]